jgi:hypothetical protein
LRIRHIAAANIIQVGYRTYPKKKQGTVARMEPEIALPRSLIKQEKLAAHTINNNGQPGCKRSVQLRRAAEPPPVPEY